MYSQMKKDMEEFQGLLRQTQQSTAGHNETEPLAVCDFGFE